jgi:oligoendopeptidase F
MLRLTLLAAAALISSSPFAMAQTAPPDATDPRWVWDLTRLFPTDAAWDAERVAVTAEIPRLAAAKGTLGKDAASLRAPLDQQSAVCEFRPEPA